MGSDVPPPGVDPSRAHSARIWNYWLGGRDNFAADREMGEQIRGFFPEIVRNARADREFQIRAVRALVTEYGIRQFLDIGAGLPTRNNTHQVAQALAPESRVVYADHDPLVLAYARELLVGDPRGRTDYLHADLTEPEAILRSAAETLDLQRPVALLLLGVLNFIEDDAVVDAVLDRLRTALPAGGAMVISHPTMVISPERAAEVVRVWNETSTPRLTARTPQRISAMFGNLRLLEPGVVSCPLWRPDGQATVTEPVDEFGGVALER